jgi:hypothetical protein
MDRPFITKMCNAYYNDFELYKEHIWPNKNSAVKELNTCIIQEIDAVKFSNTPLYESLFTFSRDQQYRIIYNLLDTHLNEKYEIDNIKINENIEVAGPTLGLIGSTIGTMSDIIGNAVLGIGALTMSVFGITFGTFILASALYFGIKHLTYTKAKAAVLLNMAADKLSKFISKATVSSRMDNAIIFSNLEICGHKCGINNFKELDKLTTFALHGHGFTTKATTQSICLFDCFIDTTHRLVEVCTKAYINCLKTSGDKLGMEQLNSITVLLKHPSSSQCKIFYEQLKKFNNDFKDAIVTLESDLDKRDKLISEYHKVLDAALRTDGGFNKPSFNKPSFNKPFHSMPKQNLPYNK